MTKTDNLSRKEYVHKLYKSKEWSLLVNYKRFTKKGWEWLGFTPSQVRRIPKPYF